MDLYCKNKPCVGRKEKNGRGWGTFHHVWVVSNVFIKCASDALH